MLKRSFFLSLAAGLLASLAFATPSMAGGSLTATTDADIIAPSVTTSTDVEITYSSAPQRRRISERPRLTRPRIASSATS